MKIVALTSENVKRLRVVHVEPGDESLVVISGENGQGKTSVLDSIALALGGKGLAPPEVIRRGETGAKVELDLGEMVVTRKWTSNEHSTLEVRSKEGAKFPSPQAMLDKLVGRLSFDPLSFLRLEPKAQAEAVRAIAGIDFSIIEKQRAEAYAMRTVVGRDVKALEVSAGMGQPQGPTPDPVDVADLLKKQRAASDLSAKVASARTASDRAKSAARAALEQEEDAKRAWAAATERRKKADEAATAYAGQVQDLEFEQSAAPNLDEINAALLAAEQTNKKVEAARVREEARQRWERKRKEETDLSAKIDAIDNQKREALAAAKFPVSGLAFDESGVRLNGLPLEQASSAEQLRVSVAMGIALNPKLKVLLVRDGSLLDGKSFHLLQILAEEAGAQVWVEMVSSEGVGVVIEDGEVKKPSSKKKAAP